MDVFLDAGSIPAISTNYGFLPFAGKVPPLALGQRHRAMLKAKGQI